MKTRIAFCFALIMAVAIFALADQFAQGNIYIPSPFKLIFGRGDSTDITISKSANNTVQVDSGNTLNIATADKLTVAGVIISQAERASFSDGAAANATNRSFFLADTTYQVTGCSEIHSVAAGGVSTLTLTKETTTGAPGAGNNLLTGSFDLNGTANTLQAGTLTATGADLQLIAGDRLSVKFANAIQSSAGIRVTCTLKRI